jgi:1,6-anhydro-N-acetylmuramate kinase
VDPHHISNQRLTKQELLFPNHNQALILKTSTDITARDIVNALNIKPPPKAIILIFGGAANSLDTSTISHLNNLLDSILRLATDADALIIDGGTKSGIMEIIGKRDRYSKQNRFS